MRGVYCRQSGTFIYTFVILKPRRERERETGKEAECEEKGENEYSMVLVLR